MYLFYVDESGDPGMSGSRFFILSSIVVHELKWKDTIEQVIAFRKALRARYGLKLRSEIHAAHFMHRNMNVTGVDKSIRLQILRESMRFQAGLADISIVNVIIDKHGKPQDLDVFETAWKYLIQRFQNTISHRNFPGPQNTVDLGMLIVDQTDEKKLRSLVRRMTKYNPVPSKLGPGFRDMLLTKIIEDPVHRDSLHSYILQLADVNAYFLFQKHQPCKYVKKKGGRNYFDLLDPILCKKASSSDPQGIVRI